MDASGNIYVADRGNNRVQVFDSSGVYLTTIGGSWGSRTGELRDLGGIDVDSSGNVYVADSDNSHIQKFAPGVSGWEQVGPDGFGDSNNLGSYWDNSAAVGSLYVGTNNWANGGEVWQLGGGQAPPTGPVYLPIILKSFRP